MRIAGIKFPDVGNGPGCRVSVFVSGCTLRCPYCFNEEAQDFSYGEDFTEEILEDILEKLGQSWITGLSLIGGDPMEPANQETVLDIVEAAKERYPEKEIWIWTGRTIDKTLEWTDYTEDILKNVDVMIDGPFINKKKNLAIKYRGSTNQRVIRNPLEQLKKKLEEGIEIESEQPVE